MSVVLDAGGVSALAHSRAELAELRRRGRLPAEVPSVVLTEALTGDHRRDFHADRLLGACQVREVDETLAREAARLRASTGRAGTVSAVDAVVAALACRRVDAVVLTSDPDDLAALAACATRPFRVVEV